MRSLLYRSLLINIFFFILLGMLYPLLITGIGKVFFPFQAAGSLVKRDNQIIGSKWLGQNFTSARYFQSRPSAAGNGYDATSSSPSNLASTNQLLRDRVEKSINDFKLRYPGLLTEKIPMNLLTTSGSGLDPHITLEAALFQVEAVARARQLPTTTVRALVLKNTEYSWFTFIAPDRVNVLKLNLALDSQ